MAVRSLLLSLLALTSIFILGKFEDCDVDVGFVVLVRSQLWPALAP